MKKILFGIIMVLVWILHSGCIVVNFFLSTRGSQVVPFVEEDKH